MTREATITAVCLGGERVEVHESAAAAIHAAVDALRASAARRVGVSTGDAVERDGRWTGSPVDEAAARWAAAADGEIIVSPVTAVLLAASSPYPLAPMPDGSAAVAWQATSVRVVLADDAVLLREGLARLLVDEGFDVVAQCGDREELLDAVAAHHPAVAVVDIRMPPTFTTEGLDAAARIRADNPATKVLLLSQHVETRHAARLLDESRGGFGYLLKDRVGDVDGLLDAIRRVAGGETVVDPDLVAAMTKRRRSHDDIDRLTEREMEVLALMAEGRSNQAIVDRLHLNVKTVETHVRNIFTKLALEPAPDDHRRVLAVLSFLRQTS